MKKLILLFTLALVTLSSCSSNDDDNSTKPATSSINPPEWVIGSWKNPDTLVTYTFTKDDILYEVGGITTSLKGQIANLQKIGIKTTIETKISQTNNTSDYSLLYSFSNTTLNFSFSKNSAIKITSNAYLSGSYIKQ